MEEYPPKGVRNTPPSYLLLKRIQHLKDELRTANFCG
ncbi:unnamed protein product, partial [Amoebophrya sp. A25]|eukprot:GSA25T00016769001.1